MTTYLNAQMCYEKKTLEKTMSEDFQEFKKKIIFQNLTLKI